MHTFLENNYLCIHPKLVDSHRVWFFKPKADYTFSAVGHTITTFNLREMCLFEDCLFETIMIIDLANFIATDVAKLTPDIIAKVSRCQKTHPIRSKGIYLINAPTYISKVTAIIKPFMKPKVFERTQIHKNADILKTIFTNDTLPKDYGGNGPSFDEMTEMLKITLQQYKSRFDQLDNLRVNESLRPEKLVDDEILGVHGTFKKLDID